MKHDERGYFVFVSLVVALLTSTTLAQQVPRIQPVPFGLPAPPMLMGPLSSNNILTNAERVHNNFIKGPTSFVNHDGHLYASTVDSKIYDLASCPPRLVSNLAPPGCYNKATCGQLTSLRRDPDTGNLLALDTFRGLFTVQPKTGAAKLVFPTSRPVNGRRPVHLNDMVVSPDGVIIMSDSSDVYSIDNDVYICMDGRPTGRLLALHPSNGFVTEILPGMFNFPNGLELTPDGDLLVTETCRAAVYWVSLKRSSWLLVKPFSLNLPGLPDNIRASGRNTYWVAMAQPRHSGITNPVDDSSRNPRYRLMGFNTLSLERIRAMFASWATVVELDATGYIVRSLHDPTGTTMSTVNEVHEFGGVLNFASYLVNYMARVLLPPETGIKISVESFIQVKKSRCQLSDSQAEELRRQMLPANVTTASPTISSNHVTTSSPTTSSNLTTTLKPASVV